MGVKVKEHRGAWWLFIDHKGNRKARRVGEGKAGKKAAELAATQIAAKLANGDTSPLRTPAAAQTFEEYATHWLETHAEQVCSPLPVSTATT